MYMLCQRAETKETLESFEFLDMHKQVLEQNCMSNKAVQQLKGDMVTIAVRTLKYCCSGGSRCIPPFGAGGSMGKAQC